MTLKSILENLKPGEVHTRSILVGKDSTLEDIRKERQKFTRKTNGSISDAGRRGHMELVTGFTEMKNGVAIFCHILCIDI